MLAFHNGQFVPVSQVGLSIADAGLVYAATVTDFCRTYQQQLYRWPLHLRRFRHDCEAVHIPLLFSDTALTEAAHELINLNKRDLPSTQELALISFATPGPLGHLLGEPTSGPPTLVLHTFPLNESRYRPYHEDGVTLELVGVLPTHPASLIPMEVKHRSRLSWYLADRKKRVPNSVACLVNEQFQAADTAIGSVVLVRDGRLIRSPYGTVLESISLQILEELAREEGIPFEQRPIHWPELLEPDAEVLLTGSGFGIAGVRQLVNLDGSSLTINWPGLMLKRLSGQLIVES
jgi:branched-chain amino acid aminotransferase